MARRARRRLGDITPDEALKEGGCAVDGFVEEWEINGSWEPDEAVWV